METIEKSCWRVTVINGDSHVDLICPFGDLERIVMCSLKSGNTCQVSLPGSGTSEYDFSRFGIKPVTNE